MLRPVCLGQTLTLHNPDSVDGVKLDVHLAPSSVVMDPGQCPAPRFPERDRHGSYNQPTPAESGVKRLYWFKTSVTDPPGLKWCGR